MDGKSKLSPKEDTFYGKPPAWVFDEQTGWINVNEFLSRTTKLREELNRKMSKCEKR